MVDKDSGKSSMTSNSFAEAMLGEMHQGDSVSDQQDPYVDNPGINCLCGHSVWSHELMDSQQQTECSAPNCSCMSMQLEGPSAAEMDREDAFPDFDKPIRAIVKDCEEVVVEDSSAVEGLGWSSVHEPWSPTTGSNEAVNHPSHYNQNGPEVIELVRWMSFNRGNAVKYIARAGVKDPAKEEEDIKKAIWYLEDELKIIRGEVK